MKIQIIDDGNFTGWVRAGFIIIGLLIMFGAYKFVPAAPFGGFLLLIGFGIAAVGGYTSRAHMLKIKPFDNSYKKARDSYQVGGDDEGGAK